MRKSSDREPDIRFPKEENGTKAVLRLVAATHICSFRRSAVLPMCRRGEASRYRMFVRFVRTSTAALPFRQRASGNFPTP